MTRLLNYSPLCSIAPLANEANRVNLIMQTVINNIVTVAYVLRPQLNLFHLSLQRDD